MGNNLKIALAELSIKNALEEFKLSPAEGYYLMKSLFKELELIFIEQVKQEQAVYLSNNEEEESNEQL